MASKSARAIAAKVLSTLQVGTNGSLSNLLDDYRERDDYPLIQELCFGACRWYPALDHLLDNLLIKPLTAKRAMYAGYFLSGFINSANCLSPIMLLSMKASRRAGVLKSLGQPHSSMRCYVTI
jgi:hypothetical protein